MQVSHYIRSDGALAHIYREERGAALALPAPSHLLQPPPRASDPATKLTGEKSDCAQTASSLTSTRDWKLQMKQPRCRHGPSRACSMKELCWQPGWLLAAKPIYCSSKLMKFLHPHEICHSICLFYTSYCVK